MATVTKGKTFTSTEQVTAAKLGSLVDSATVTEIVNADINSSAGIVDTKLAQIATASKVSGAALTALSSIPSGAGAIPSANLTAIYADARVKVGSFTRDLTTASGDVSYTGVGFRPVAILFIANLPSSTALTNMSWGVDDITTDGHLKLYGNTHSDMDVRSIFLSDGTNSQSAVVKTFDADGFTLTWTKASSPTGTATVKYIAWR
jgi:hypothetical protein